MGGGKIFGNKDFSRKGTEIACEKSFQTFAQGQIFCQDISTRRWLKRFLAFCKSFYRYSNWDGLFIARSIMIQFFRPNIFRRFQYLERVEQEVQVQFWSPSSRWPPPQSTRWRASGHSRAQGHKRQVELNKRKKYSKLWLDYNTGYLENNAQYKG